jgi:hypothetical protein
MPRLLLIYAMGTVAVPVSVWLTFWGRGSIGHFSFASSTASGAESR